jgi:hypothetical protein
MTLHIRMHSWSIVLAVASALALVGCATESDIGNPDPSTSEIADHGTAEIVDHGTAEIAPADEASADFEATARRANLTNFESYPDPDSEECREYNGCTWAGYFAFVNGRKSESWVRSHNIIAVHQRDAQRYKLKTFRLTKNGRSIDAKVYDMCADSDCNGCCTRNARSTGFLIDIEKYTMQRFGSGSGTVQWTCLDC